MASKSERRESARQKAADRAANQRSDQRRRRVLLGAAITVTLAVGATIGGFAIAGQNHADASRANQVTGKEVTTAPPWAAPTDPSARARAAGLEVAGMEGTALHTHQHLSITIDGVPVTVPANIGVDTQSGGMSALHTHDTAGIIHVESAKAESFVLGQLFTEWGVALEDRQVGGYVNGRDGTVVRVFVNNEQTSTPLPKLRLEDRDDIAIVITTDGATPTAPAPFDWAAAE
ncbi:hypothetical protein DEJ13_07800 [Curtobacterium sp. MCLR17_007]|jgi:hypothetical protein|uniref:hypothetical protein n=1 Tax=unclassified Curtobacterium TaxID=257496 RepID=UPI000A5D654A|nr:MULTISPECIES: hypothetical protein [unclassified Curtobacterium]MBF4581432.1 hypothetical protein [Curtobacterium sp. VKM Ac-2865]WIB61721.1 hypothetical protein DEJ13_07800 [Curtobacterium sp. MCLR17_007]